MAQQPKWINKYLITLPTTRLGTHLVRENCTLFQPNLRRRFPWFCRVPQSNFETRGSWVIFVFTNIQTEITTLYIWIISKKNMKIAKYTRIHSKIFCLSFNWTDVSPRDLCPFITLSVWNGPSVSFITNVPWIRLMWVPEMLTHG